MNALFTSLATAALAAGWAHGLAPHPFLPPPPASIAQQAGQPAVAPDSPAPLKVDATLVSLDVLVTDEDGRVLRALAPTNFRILDNGSSQELVSFAPVATPITIVVVMEYSAASYGYFAPRATQWTSSFLDHLDAGDWVALVTFDMNSRVRADFTHRRYEIRDALSSIGFPQFNEVNLFDTLTSTLDMLDNVRGKKSILLIATGVNTFSASTLDDVLKRLRRTDATIFCVGLAEAELGLDGTLAYTQARNQLSSFSKQTGGIALFPRFDGELPGIFRSIVGFQRSEYNLTFRPPPSSRDGRYHKLKVEIVGADGKPLRVTDEKGRKRNVEVYTRQGYMAPRD